MDPKDAAMWIIEKKYSQSYDAPFDGMDDDAILTMFLPLARAYLSKIGVLARFDHDPLRRHGDDITTAGNSEGI